MQFTFNWLKRYLKTELSASEIADRLNELGLEIEKIQDNAKIYSKFCVAEIIEAVRHPNAEKLKICKVSCGHEGVYQVVCGASNARPGIKVVMAQIGAVIPDTGTMIKKSVIRGHESYGMLCSTRELSLDSKDPEGILELERGEIGASFAEIFGLEDVVIEVALTPNRGDCASVLGVARELAASGAGSFNLSTFNQSFLTEKEKMPFEVHLLDVESCSEFTLRYIKNVNNCGEFESTESRFLREIGYESKSKLVDISNFVMFDVGRPNHIYDADKIKGDIAIRRSLDGERFVALNGIEYKLPEGITVVADQEKILSIAGVIGGIESRVDSNTRSIVIEVANFSAEAVLIAARQLNIRTDAKFRFERHIDFASTKYALEMITSMIVEHCGGNVVDECLVLGSPLSLQQTIDFDLLKIQKISGLSFSKEQVLDILDRLGFKYIEPDRIQIPSWRAWDIASAADLTEEVLRVYGLAKIPEKILSISVEDVVEEAPELQNAASRLLDRRMHEVISWSFANNMLAEQFGDSEDLLVIQNPINSEMSVMRPSILCTLIPLVQKNYVKSFQNISLFELGSVYSKQKSQRHCLAGIRSGLYALKGVHSAQRAVDFFDVKDDVFAALSEFRVDTEKYIMVRESPSYYHPGRSASIKLGKSVVAFLGEIHPQIVSGLNMANGALCGFEIFVDQIPIHREKMAKNKLKRYEYQSVERDLAFVLKDEVNYSEVVNSIKALKLDMIERIDIFDIYQGVGIEKGYKSMAFSIKLQPFQYTLKDIEIEEIVRKIIDKVCFDFKAQLRS